MIRVGTRQYFKGKHVDPSFKGFKPIVVLTKSTEYGSLGPYVLRDEKGRIFENVWQFSKLYKTVPAIKETYSRWDKRIIWDQQAQIHVNDEFITRDYLSWREKGMNCRDAIRYPVGRSFRTRATCIGSLMNVEMKNDEIRLSDMKLFDYVESRKVLYLPEYCRLVKKQKQYRDLQNLLKAKVNLLIIEVDGPRESSLSYYSEKYDVYNTFIQNNTMLVTTKNLKIMLNDTKHPFGHGYCLAASLLGIDKEILL
uniref:Uncharacterized protein n=1 Tax=Pithovirus LCPAC406 TaxID=2506599 RepID=A0A481ZH23_9VIRU|nr:MAG: uncharacterized protein LCPAC406_03840 [Pithovirus LCPAC406]